MATGKEIRYKIKSIENTKKITKAMEMVAASKMRKAQDRMYAARPYSQKIRDIAANLSQTNPEYVHPFMVKRQEAKKVGIIVVTTDKGLCGGMNTNVLRLLVARIREFEAQKTLVKTVAIGNKGLGFLHRMGVQVVSQVIQLGDVPHLDKLIGPIKVLLDQYEEGKLDAIHLAYTRFVNTMKQEAVCQQLLPLSSEALASKQSKYEIQSSHAPQYTWDYIYEPDMQSVIDDLLMRYVESLIYQTVAENMASEQSARMVAMKSASDNAGHVIDELKLIYNKTRQAAITKELSEIVAGAAAV